MKGRILNRRLIEVIRGVADQIRNTIGRRIFSWGMERALNILRNARMMSIFPSLRKWVSHDPYIFWLGTDLLVKMRRWIWV